MAQAKPGKPAAPPVYRPQTPAVAKMTAPPVYRPKRSVQPKSVTVTGRIPQARTAAPQVQVIPPSVYRPARPAQAKSGVFRKSNHPGAPVQQRPSTLQTGGAPPVYRPEPSVQRKSGKAAPQSLQPRAAPPAQNWLGNGSVAQRAGGNAWGVVAQPPVVPLLQIQAEQAAEAAAEEREREMQEAYEEFVNNPDLGIRFYQVDSDAGRAHARARHTYEGIWAAGAVLTAHPTQVAIFATLEDFQAALDDMPEREDAWTAAGAGRYDADVGNVHYQGTLLADTMSLFSCYPTNRNRTRSTVVNALRDADSLDDFKTRVG